MKETLSFVKNVWQSLNTDISPILQTISDEIAAIYNPQLVPVKVDGITLEWVDKRTGRRPIFS